MVSCNLQQVTWFFHGTLVSSTKKSNCNDTTEMLLKVTFNTSNNPNPYEIVGDFFNIVIL
jgi:hypothetical protein